MSAAAIVRDKDWQEALEGAIREAGMAEDAATADLALFFASDEYAEHLPAMVRRVQSATGAAVVAGCSGQGIIGPEREIEGEAALSLLALPLLGATLRGCHISQSDLEQTGSAEGWHALTGVGPEEVNAWLLFADPFHLDVEALLQSFTEAYPGAPIVGGLASGSVAGHRTFVFLNGEVHSEGAVAVALGGGYTIKTVVSQGADPIGEPWIITAAEGSVVQTISQRPAYEVLVETIKALPREKQERASRNLLVGLAMDEYKDSFGRGDFLIRGLMGADPNSGAIAIGAHPRVGQTIQFQIRDA
ncbi:MAG TPA: FIST N-terminal domain-containing protein, partial [Chloroflexota bacterium]|nr:FIST N-terminal domain-containing protein [Chloroflexota bacterium]